MAGPHPPEPVLSVRALAVLTVGLLVGLTAGALAYLAQWNAPGAVLVGGGATGGAMALFHALTGR